MFKCQKVQITADAESALRPSSVRVVTRKRKDRKKKEARKRKWNGKQGRESTEWKQRDMSRWGTKKKSASLLDVLFFPWWSSFSGSEVRWGRGRRVMVGVGMLGSKGHCCCVCAGFFCFVRIGPVISCCRVTALSLDAWRRSGAWFCPGTPAERPPAPTPGSRRPPSLSGLKHKRTKHMRTFNTRTCSAHVHLCSSDQTLTLWNKPDFIKKDSLSFASFRKPAEGQYFFVCDSTQSNLKHFGVLLARKV